MKSFQILKTCLTGDYAITAFNNNAPQALNDAGHSGLHP